MYTSAHLLLIFDRFKHLYSKRLMVLLVGDSDAQRDHYLLYLTILFGLLTVASAGIPLVFGDADATSDMRKGIGIFITLVGLAPIPYVIYKILIVFLRPIINDRKQAEKWRILTFFGYFLICIITTILGRRWDAIGIAVYLIYGVYTAFWIVTIAATEAVLREKGIETIYGSLLKWHKDLSKSLLYKDIIYVYAIPLGFFYFSFIMVAGLPFLLFGPYIAIVIAFSIAIILSLDGSITRWRKNRNDIDTLSLIDSLKRNLIPIYLLPAILYVISAVIFLFLITAVMYFNGWGIPESDMLFALIVVSIITSIPFIIAAKTAVFMWKFTHKGLINHVPVPTTPIYYITNLQEHIKK